MTPAVIGATIERVAARWARRVPWVSADDIAQQAWVEVQASLKYYDERRDLRAYTFSVASRCAARYCAENSAPVSGSVRETYYRLRLLQCLRVKLGDADDGTDGVVPVDNAPTPEMRVQRAEVEHAVRKRLAEVIGRDEAVFLLLGMTYPPRELADFYKAQPRNVSDRLWRLQQKCKADIELRLLWEEL